MIAGISTLGGLALLRATLEGVCCRMNSVMLALGDVAGPAQEIRVSGSFTRTELCVKILADAFDHEINAPNVDEGRGVRRRDSEVRLRGSARRHLGHGTIRFSEEDLHRPRPAKVEVYKTLFGVYDRIYRNLLQEYSDISAFQDG
jgi:gluconokinase